MVKLLIGMYLWSWLTVWLVADQSRYEFDWKLIIESFLWWLTPFFEVYYFIVDTLETRRWRKSRSEKNSANTGQSCARLKVVT